ncbi:MULTISPECIES: relaxase/mobilization nuclease domain-containing protein [Chitinophagaceae]
MIAKQTLGSAASVGKMVDYVMRENGNKHEDEKADIFFQHALCGNTSPEIIEQMQMAIDLNKGRCEKPIFHAIFSLAEKEHLNPEQENKLSQKLMNEFGLDKNPILGIKHTSSQSKDHYHFLISLPPIDRTATPNIYKSKMRLMKIARECEREFGLQSVLMPKQFLSPEQKSAPRHNKRKEKANEDLRKALTGTRSMIEFINKMNDLGYSLNKGRGLGITENSTGIYYKASDLGLSLGKIEKIIAYNEKLFGDESDFSKNFSDKKLAINTMNENGTTKAVQSFNFISEILELISPDINNNTSVTSVPHRISTEDDEEELIRKRKRKPKRGYFR